MEKRDLPIIGSNTKVTVAGIKGVPAKIDTGAEYSSIWASDIDVTPDHQLQFRLFAPQSPFYTGELMTTDKFLVRVVRNSTGHEQIRYRTQFSVYINKRRIRMNFTLADRSRNNFPILIGRHAIMNKFLVDVSRICKENSSPKANELPLNSELKRDPYAFHKKYIAKDNKSK